MRTCAKNFCIVLCSGNIGINIYFGTKFLTACQGNMNNPTCVGFLKAVCVRQTRNARNLTSGIINLAILLAIAMEMGMGEKTEISGKIGMAIRCWIGNGWERERE